MKYLVPVIFLASLLGCDSDSQYINGENNQPQRHVPINSILTTRPASIPLRRNALATASSDGIELLESLDFSPTSTLKWNTCSGFQLIDTFASNGFAAGVVKSKDCVQQLVDASVLAEDTKLDLNCEARLRENSTEWTGIGLSFYDNDWNFISEPSPALVGTKEFRNYRVSATLPASAQYALAWIYTESGADVRTCSLTRPVDDEDVNPTFDNVLLNSSFDNGTDAWIDYCGGDVQTGNVSSDNTVLITSGSCLTQSIGNTQLSALRGGNFQFQCELENASIGYAELVTNLGGNVSTQQIQQAGGKRLATITGTVPDDIGNAYISITKNLDVPGLEIYQCDLRRIDTIVNQPPVANDDYVLFPAFNLSLSSRDLGITANDFDPEGALSGGVTITRQPAFGTLFLSGNVVDYFTTVGSPDSFSYTLRDAQGLVSNEATVTLEFDGVISKGNNPPTVIDDTFSVAPGATQIVDVLLNDSDSDNDPLVNLTVTRGPSHGYTSLDLETGVLTYTHRDDGSENDSFEYSVSDGTDTRTATAFILVRPETGFLFTQPLDPQEINSNTAYDISRAVLIGTDSGLRAQWLLYNFVDHSSYRISAYIDVDRNKNTGFRGFNNEYAIGADYLLEGDIQYIYKGTGGSNWNWERVAYINPSAVRDGGSVRLPLEEYFDSINGVDYFFRADNSPEGKAIDYYPDAANDSSADPSSRYFTFMPGSAR